MRAFCKPLQQELLMRNSALDLKHAIFHIMQLVHQHHADARRMTPNR
jgi:hypothetical protein